MNPCLFLLSSSYTLKTYKVSKKKKILTGELDLSLKCNV